MSFKEFLQSRSFWKHFLLANAVVALLLVLGMVFLNFYTLHDSKVEVPDFKGIYISDLDKFVEGHSVSYEIVDSVYNMKKDKGTVIEQDPAPGSTVKEGRTIYLTVNAMLNQQVKMPDLVDLSLRQATSLLETYGLKVGAIRYREGLPPVMEQLYKGKRIAPGTMVDKGSSIDLVAGLGDSKGLIPVPDLFGLTLPEARAILASKSLLVGVVLQDATGRDTLSAQIYRQDPTPGAEGLYDGAPVNLWLTGSPEVLENEKNQSLENE